jgi:hypothetical protein
VNRRQTKSCLGQVFHSKLGSFATHKEMHGAIEQCAFKNVNNCLNTNIYSYLETSGGQSCNLYLNVVHFFNASVY